MRRRWNEVAAYQGRVFRIMAYFELAEAPGLSHAGGQRPAGWSSGTNFAAVVDYPDVSTDRLLSMRPRPDGIRPETLDVLVATNLHVTSFPIWRPPCREAWDGRDNLNPERKYPSMFEPIHGSALISWERHANPIGTFWWPLMLEHLERRAAESDESH